MNQIVQKDKPYCLWLCGPSRSGKTTLSYALLQDKLRNVILIDGDKFREHFNPPRSFSRDDIKKSNQDAANMAYKLLADEFNVIVTMITPLQEIRSWIKQYLPNVKMVKLECPEEIIKQRPNYRKEYVTFEEGNFEKWDLVLDTSKPIEVCKEQIHKMLGVE